MDFDTAISVGGQSLLDTVLGLLNPALQRLYDPIPTPIPGLLDSVIRVHDLQPVIRKRAADSKDRVIELAARIDLNAAVPVPVNVGLLDITIPSIKGVIGLKPPTGTALFPNDATINLTPSGGSLTSVPPVPLTLGAITGSESIPDATVLLDRITGAVRFPALKLRPLAIPSLLPIPLSTEQSLEIAITLRLTLGRGGVLQKDLGRDTGHGLQLMILPEISLPDLSTSFVDELAASVESQALALADGLLAGLPIGKDLLTTVTTHLAGVAQELPAIVADTLFKRLDGLLVRTGRLVLSVPQVTTCNSISAPQFGRARLENDKKGVPYLQIGFSSKTLAADPVWPTFARSDVVDVQVDIATSVVRDLLCCVIEKLPSLGIHYPPAHTDTATSSCCTWSDVVVNLGLIALRGDVSLCIRGSENIPKTVVLAFDLREVVSVPATFLGSDILVAHLAFELTIGFDLNDVMALTNLRIVKPPFIQACDVQAGDLLRSVLDTAFTLATLLNAGVGAILLLPDLAILILQSIVRNYAELIFSTVKELQSVVALPPGVLEAFGKLIPAQFSFDDLRVRGVLRPSILPALPAPVLVP